MDNIQYRGGEEIITQYYMGKISRRVVNGERERKEKKNKVNHT